MKAQILRLCAVLSLAELFSPLVSGMDVSGDRLDARRLRLHRLCFPKEHPAFLLALRFPCSYLFLFLSYPSKHL